MTIPNDHATPTRPAVTEKRPMNPSTSAQPLYPQATRELAEQRTRLAPGTAAAFRAFSQSVFAPGALPTKTKQLIAVAVAHVTQCPYCIRSHTGAALRHGAKAEEIMEAIWIAAEMRAGGAYAHSALALDVVAHEQAVHAAEPLAMVDPVQAVVAGETGTGGDAGDADEHQSGHQLFGTNRTRDPQAADR